MLNSGPHCVGCPQESIGELEVLREYLLDRCSPEPNSGCWIWTGTVEKYGYGCARVNYFDRRGKNTWVYAHRASAEAWLGFDALRDPRCVCHKCDNQICINPAHLFPATRQDNMRDAAIKGRLKRVPKVACLRGHPYTLENTVIRRGQRLCRVCCRLHRKKYRESIRGLYR